MSAFERMTAAEYRSAVKAATLPARRSRKNKYGAKPVRVDGHYFPSAFEANRYRQLKLLERSGTITNLVLQPRFDLVVDGAKVGVYVGDFGYREKGQHVVEDTKGVVLPLYKLKRDLFRTCYPQIDFREIKQR